jgi:glycosyltransferase involved in cell wall biosynthesis
MISVVIPALNEQRYLGRCLESLAHQDYQGSFEIIVVDNGSTDATAALASGFGAKVISEARRGIAWARQSGFVVAKGDIIASTDADTIVPADWLSRIDRLFRQHPEAVAVAGHFLLLDGPIVVRLAIRFSLILMPLIIKLQPQLWQFGGFNFAVRSQAFTTVGGFNTHVGFGEDIDLCQRLRRLGRVVFSPELVVLVSGRAFARDRLGLNHLVNYLSRMLLKRTLLPVIFGAEEQSKTSRLQHQ